MVIDTSALFAIEFVEPERSAFSSAIKTAAIRLMSAATAVECVSVFAGRRPGIDPMIAFSDLVRDFAIEIPPMDEAQWRAAADGLIRFGKGRHPARLNLGDSFAYALAKVTSEPLLYKGGDFALTDVVSAV
jgi:ribonuclease VapC